MKNRISLSIIFLLLSSVAFGQGTWTRQAVPDSSAAIIDINFIDSDTGWAVGHDGIVISCDWQVTENLSLELDQPGHDAVDFVVPVLIGAGTES